MDNTSKKQIIADAFKYHSQGNIKEAIKYYQLFIDLGFSDPIMFSNYGVICKQIGNLEKAIELYKKSIALFPNSPDSYSNLGNLLKDLNRLDEAEFYTREAIKINPNFANAYINLGNILKNQGNLIEAKNIIEASIKLNPKSADSFNTLGSILIDQGEIDLAKESIEKAILLNPNLAEAFNNMALIYQEINQLDNAYISVLKAINLNPKFCNAYLNLGQIYKVQDKLEQAKKATLKAIEINPNSHSAYSNLSNIFNNLKEPELAKTSALKALELKPGFAEAYLNLGNALIDLGRYEEAKENTLKALPLKDKKNIAYINLGHICNSQENYEDAKKYLKKAIELKSDNGTARHNLSINLLKSKQFIEGWAEYEWRWKDKSTKFNLGEKLKTNQPEWSPDQRGRVLLWPEQGLGDQLMFASLIPDFIDYVDQLIIKIDPRLIPLLKRTLPENIKYISKEDHIDESEYDSHIAMGSLPKYLRNSIESFQLAKPLKLKVNQQQSDSLRSKFLDKKFDKIIGISWKSKKLANINQCKSLSLEDFILKLYSPNICFVSLQYGDVKEEIKQLKQKHNIEIYDVEEIDKFYDIDGLASLIHACDEVISMRNSTVPLAGAIGIKSHILIPTNCYWWWGVDDAQSYWYPSLKLFRQKEPGEWNQPFSQVKNKIE